MLYMFEVQIPVDAYYVFGLKRRSFLFVIDKRPGTSHEVPGLLLSRREPVAKAMQVRDTPRSGITSGASYPVGAIKAHAKGAYKTPPRVSFSMQNKGILRTQSVVYL